jgi:hypothetical protein
MNCMSKSLPLSVLVLLAACEKQLALHVLPASDRNSFLIRVSQAGDTTSPVEEMRVHRATIYRWMNRLGITVPTSVRTEDGSTGQECVIRLTSNG